MKHLLITICTFFLLQPGIARPLPPAQDSLAAREPEVKEMIGFLQYMLNTLGDGSTTYSAKETIIFQSYSKLFDSPTVQVEDDLDPTRSTSLHKDVIAYLKDVDFFYKNAQFVLDITDISSGKRSNGQPFIKVTLKRSLKGLSLSGDSVNNVSPRYVEINIDPEEQDLKIVSMYTHEADDAEDYAQWWDGLSLQWRKILAEAANLPANPGKKDWQRLDNIRSLDLSDKTLLVNLQGIEKLRSLQTLSLSRSGVTDLSPLRYLNELRVLDISHTPITDVSPLRFNWQLAELDISQSSVRDVSALAALKKLSALRMNGLRLQSTRALPRFPALTEVSARGSGLSTLTILSANTQLRALELANNPLTDFSALADFSKVQKLDLSGTQFSNPTLLQGMTELEVLRINRCPVTSLAPLAPLKTLSKIWCDQSSLSAKALSDWKTVRPDVLVVFETKELQNWYMQFSPAIREKLLAQVNMTEGSSEAITRITQLDSLYLVGESPALNLLSRMENLRTLHLINAGLTDLKGLESLRQLRSVSFRDNPVTNVWALQNCPFLERIDLENSKITELEPLGSIPALKWLNIDGTLVSESQVKEFSLAHPAIAIVHHRTRLIKWWESLSAEWQATIKENMGWNQGAIDGYRLAELGRARSLSIDARKNKIETLSPLDHFWALSELHIDGMVNFNSQSLPIFSKLRSLRLNNMHVEYWSFLERYPELIELDLQNTSIDQAGVLQHLKQLESLNLAGTPIRNVRKLDELSALRFLSIANTRVSNIKPLDDLHSLEQLECFNTRISKFTIRKYEEDHPECSVRYY